MGELSNRSSQKGTPKSGKKLKKDKKDEKLMDDILNESEK